MPSSAAVMKREEDIQCEKISLQSMAVGDRWQAEAERAETSDAGGPWMQWSGETSLVKRRGVRSAGEYRGMVKKLVEVEVGMEMLSAK